MYTGLSYVPGVVPSVQEGALISGYIIVHIGRLLYACSTVRESRPEVSLVLVSEHGVLVYISARVAWLYFNASRKNQFSSFRSAEPASLRSTKVRLPLSQLMNERMRGTVCKQIIFGAVICVSCVRGAEHLVCNGTELGSPNDSP